MIKIANLLLPMVLMSCGKTEDLSCNCRKVYYERRTTTVITNGLPSIKVDFIKTGASEKATECNSTSYQSMGGDSFYKIECN